MTTKPINRPNHGSICESNRVKMALIKKSGATLNAIEKAIIIKTEVLIDNGLISAKKNPTAAIAIERPRWAP